MYGYIDHNGQFIRPTSIGYDSVTIADPTDEQLAEMGYLLRVDTNPPAETGYVSYYVEEDCKAIQQWKKETVEESPSQLDVIESQVAYLAMMTGYTDILEV